VIASSALEVIPLVLIGFEAYQTSRAQRAAPWMACYRWPIRFFVGVAFWNLVGEGLSGFLQQPWLQTLRWLRIIGDTVFMLGTAALTYFMLGLWTGWSYEPTGSPARTKAPGAIPSPLTP
jgi:nitric oxide reductase subunit B